MKLATALHVSSFDESHNFPPRRMCSIALAREIKQSIFAIHIHDGDNGITSYPIEYGNQLSLPLIPGIF